MENENIYDKIMELFGKVPENFSILEEQVDIKTQMSYFEKSKEIKEQKQEKNIIFERKDELLEEQIGEEQKKEILVALASLDDVEAFRLIEKFHTSAPENLKEWSALALQESRMTLESSLLNENQVIISTGLGGKGKKLRYFAVLAAKDEIGFSDLQKRLVQKELEFVIKKNDGEIEEIEFKEDYCLMTLLIPLNVSIKELLLMSIEECNQIGNFINPKFILTNVRTFEVEEIKESWNKVSD